jgi:hypothetical protein
MASIMLQIFSTCKMCSIWWKNSPDHFYLIRIAKYIEIVTYTHISKHPGNTEGLIFPEKE